MRAVTASTKSPFDNAMRTPLSLLPTPTDPSHTDMHSASSFWARFGPPCLLSMLKEPACVALNQDCSPSHVTPTILPHHTH